MRASRQRQMLRHLQHIAQQQAHQVADSALLAAGTFGKDAAFVRQEPERLKRSLEEGCPRDGV